MLALLLSLAHASLAHASLVGVTLGDTTSTTSLVNFDSGAFDYDLNNVIILQDPSVPFDLQAVPASVLAWGVFADEDTLVQVDGIFWVAVDDGDGEMALLVAAEDDLGACTDEAWGMDLLAIGRGQSSAMIDWVTTFMLDLESHYGSTQDTSGALVCPSTAAPGSQTLLRSY